MVDVPYSGTLYHILMHFPKKPDANQQSPKESDNPPNTTVNRTKSLTTSQASLYFNEILVIATAILDTILNSHLLLSIKNSGAS